MKGKYFLFFLLIAVPAAAQQDYEISGYVKYLFSSVNVPFVDENLNDHLLHWRVNTRFYPSDNFTFTAELRNRFFYGESVEQIPGYYRSYIKNDYDLASLDALLWKSKKSIGYSEIDRLYLDYNTYKFQATLGRQRIAWGTSWVWNPTDIFNPLSVLDFDYEERPAVDAARLQYYLGPVSKIELAYKPSRDNNYIAAALYKFNLWDYDFNLLAGIKEGKWLAGGGWSGDILTAGFRGEILVREELERKSSAIPDFFRIPSVRTGTTVVSAVFSGDYTFPNSLYIHTEILYNNVGVNRYTSLSQVDAVERGLLTAARLSLYQEFSYDITPLMRGSLFGIINPDDESYIIVPSLSYSVITNLDLFLIALIAEGNPFTEFGGYGKSYFLRLKFSW